MSCEFLFTSLQSNFTSLQRNFMSCKFILQVGNKITRLQVAFCELWVAF